MLSSYRIVRTGRRDQAGSRSRGGGALTIFFVSVLTDGLGLIGLIYKLLGHSFSFRLKWRMVTVITRC